MAGMKITLSSAMRARDVSRPQPHHDAAAQAADAAEPAVLAGTARAAPAPRPSPAPASPGPSEPVPGTGVKNEGSRRRRSRRRSGRLAG